MHPFRQKPKYNTDATVSPNIHFRDRFFIAIHAASESAIAKATMSMPCHSADGSGETCVCGTVWPLWKSGAGKRSMTARMDRLKCIIPLSPCLQECKDARR